MALTEAAMFERALARDGEYDGRFLIGVVSTGIYCLPSCPARKPKRENTRFFESEAAARSAGLRACKRCRPDHFYRDHDPALEAVEALARRVRAEPHAFADVADLAAASGIGRTKLHGLFREHFHESPAGFLARARVRAATGRLARAGARPLDVGAEVGFESTSAFHDNFTRATGMPPGEYRALLHGSGPFRIRLPRDFRPVETLARVGRDAASRTERATPRGFAAALELDGRPAVVEVELTELDARCTVDAPRRLSRSARARAHEAAWRLLGLASDPGAFERRVRRLPGMSRLVRGRRGLRMPLTLDAFDALVWSIVGQQVNLAFAMTTRRRLIELAARSEHAGMLPHPSPADVARLEHADLLRLQFSRRKAEYTIDTARRIATGELSLDELSDVSATRAERILLAQRGIGPWSAAYILMRGLGLADCLPVGDAGLVASLKEFFELDRRPDAKETRERMQPFRPHRSLACLHFWKRLDA